jgi:DNA (cytosine-5)-methyltransferase 1
LCPSCRRFVQGARPRLVFFENVEGHVSLGLSTVLADLEEDGYTAAWGIFSASEVGAPHQRKRVVILAYDRELHNPGADKDGNNANGIQELSRDSSLWHEIVRRGEGDGGAVWPSRPGEKQYAWEPPRVVGNSANERLCPQLQDKRQDSAEGLSGSEADNGTGEVLPVSQTQPPMGGNADGPADGLDFPGCTGLSDSELEEIYGWMVKGTNRTDELRMCGNGVVPQTAERAFRVLSADLGLTGADDTILTIEK